VADYATDLIMLLRRNCCKDAIDDGLSSSELHAFGSLL
jgi:hypothetical protein